MELVKVSNFINGRFLLSNLKSDRKSILKGTLLSTYSVDSLGSNYNEKIYYDTVDYFFAEHGINICTVNINGKNKECVVRYDSELVQRVEFLKNIPSYFKIKMEKEDSITKYFDLIEDAIHQIYPAGLGVDIKQTLSDSKATIRVFKKRDSYRVVNNSGLKMILSFDNSEYSGYRRKGKFLQPNLDVVCEAYRNKEDFETFLREVVRDFPKLIRIESNELMVARNNL